MGINGDVKRRVCTIGTITIAMIITLILTGCDQGGDASGPPAPPPPRPEKAVVEYETPEVEKYCKIADDYARAIAAKRWLIAYEVSASYVRDRMTAEEFAEEQEKAWADFGTPIEAEPFTDAETDTNLLRGAKVSLAGKTNRGERSMIRAQAQHATGTTPAEIPFEIRRASLGTAIHIDPLTVPKKSRARGVTLTAEHEVNAQFSVMLVEEDGELRVAHSWLRWPSFWDD